MRHDARACGTLLGEFHEVEVLAVEHTCVERHLGHRARHCGEGEGHVALHLASAHLGIDHVVVHRVKTQQPRGHRAVQGE